MIVSSYEKKKLKRLEEKNIVCETLYYNPNQNNPSIFVRSTDGKMLENIQSKAIKEKRYFMNDECMYIEKIFDSHILYTVNSYDNESEKIICPSCGNEGEVKDFIEGCPFCRGDFNFGMNNQNISKPSITYRLFNMKFWIIYFILLTIFYIRICPEEINIAFIIFIPLILILVFCFEVFIYFFYLVLCSIFSSTKENISKDDSKLIWKSDKNENQFYNDLNKTLINYMYKENDLIDYDITKNCGLDFISSDLIDITLKIRRVYYDTEFSSTIDTFKISMKFVNATKVEDNHGVLKCPNCGADVDSSEIVCKYCKNEVYYNRDWIIDKIEKLETSDK